MKNSILKKILPHLSAVVIFLIVNVLYFNPAFTGKVIQQGDLNNVKGMKKEIEDYRKKTGEEALWTNSMFGGMPAYHISIKYKGNFFDGAHKVLSLGLPNPAKFVFLYMIGFYILMIIMGVNPWLSIVAAVSFSFSSYLIQIIEAGHSSKAHAIAYMAPILGAALLVFKKRYLLGGVLFAFFFTMELRANHIQITYYLAIIFIILGLFKLYRYVKEKELLHFGKSVGIMLGGVLLAILINIGHLWGTYEYSKQTMRGQSELTIDGKNEKNGLDRDYITNWSYGIGETWNLFIPNFKGGSSTTPLGENEKNLTKVDDRYKQIVAGIPQYFGDMPFTSGPYYIGAVAIFLFLLALFYYKGRMKYVVLIAILIAMPLSWGKNFMAFTDFFIDYIPMYSKFRTVPMAQVIVELLVPFLAFLTLDKLLNRNPELLRSNLKKFYIASGIPIGLLILFYMAPSSFNSFFGDLEYSRIQQQLISAKWPQNQMNELFDNIETARITLFKADVLRTLLLVLAAALLIWLFAKKKLNNIAVMAGIGLLILIDQVGVDRRYLNDDSFVREREAKVPFQMSGADKQILQDPDPNYRVLNLATNTFNDASTSYYHKSIGGYHAAKLMRYQELIDHHISKQNMKVLNMLNTKYFIVRGENGAPIPQQNPDAMGNAWFVDQVSVVKNADEEIMALNDFEPSKEAIIDQRYKGDLGQLQLEQNVDGQIELSSYSPKKLTYKSSSNKKALAVFSEIYYEGGWHAYVDGEETEVLRVNYLLRGLVIPSGSHDVVFEFNPKSYTFSTSIAATSSIVLILLMIWTGYREFKNQNTATTIE